MSIPFAPEARRCFDVLAQQYGMSCVISNDQEVRYEGDSVFVVVNFDNGRSYELVVEVGRISQPERSYSLAEVLRLRGVTEAKTIDGAMVSASSGLPGVLARLVRLTSQYATDFLMGNEASFAEVAELRQRETSAYAVESALSDARSRSGVAWEKRDYNEIVKLLEPVELHLSPAERKRLDYARRHLSS